MLKRRLVGILNRMGNSRKKRFFMVIPCFLLLWVISYFGLTTAKMFWQNLANMQEGIRPSEKTIEVNEKGFNKDSYRVVHLDLKGGPPRMSYLRELLPLLAAQGCTALLIEYEDMFPYTGVLANISAKNAYSKSEIRKLGMWAHDLGMEVIPLVQTFGHLEFVVKLAEFRALREVPEYPQEVCPSNPHTLPLIEEMVTQVMDLHQGARYIHIGSDEVFHINICRECASRKLNSRQIYAEHVMAVAQMVQMKYPQITVIIWDDMIRQWSPQFLSTSSLTRMVEPMVWIYTEDVQKLLPHYVWHWYSRVFQRVWVAGAFKGATLPTSVLPDMEGHYRNQRSWLKFLEKADVQISGFVLTGWSRYDHFAVLCELLPTAIPSLLLNLILISDPEMSEADLFNRWRESLKCPSSYNFDIYSLKYDKAQLGACTFPGADIFNSVLHYIILKVKVDTVETAIIDNNGWMSNYNIIHNYTSPSRVLQSFHSFNVPALQQDVAVLKRNMEVKLLKYVDKHSVSEWLEQKVLPLENKLRKIGVSMESLIRRDVWPRRPLR